MDRTNSLRFATALLATASTLCFVAPAAAQNVLFSTSSDAEARLGERTTQAAGLTQVRLDGGATASFIDSADYRLNADGSIELYSGSVTVAGEEGTTIVRMPEGVEGQVSGAGSAASFSVGKDRKVRGHVLSGSASILSADNARRFTAGELFTAGPSQRPQQVVANGAQATPDSEGDGTVFGMGGDAGPIAAAQNGVPVTLGDALAAAGASGDILAAANRVEAAAANPLIETFPVGDLQLLVAAATRLEGAYGGTPFTGAQADIIRTYLQFLANGGNGQNFLSAYAGFLTQYLDLIRSGAAPSGFSAASLAQIDSFIAFTDRTAGFGSLSAQDRVLVEAYLAFIRGGGNADAFAGTFTDLTAAYFAFVRGGGDPAAFTGATQATLDDYIAFLADSGLAQQLAAADQALLAAYLQNGGLAFASDYRTVLDAYFAFLAAGNLPSDYTTVDQATLQAYLATLQSTGLLNSVLGGNADFYAAYLAFLQSGGNVDGFAGLPANIFAGYAAQLDAYFAFLQAGNLPSTYSDAEIAVLQAYLAELQAAGALDRFLGNQAGFYADYLAFLQGGGQVDTFAGLNANIFAGYASALATYYDYLANGGVPSAYGALTQQEITAFLAALQSAGATSRFLTDLADFYSEYFAFLSGGGNPDTFAGLPVPPDFPAFADALNAYAAFLAGGGLPANYSAADLALLQSYLEAIVNSGQLASLLGANADLLEGYFTYLAGGGTANGFAGLPLYADYVTALNAYYAFLANGGLPADYTALDAATIRNYLDALAAAGGLSAFASLDGFFADYYAFLSSGGQPTNFAGLPLYADYIAALNAYYAYLAAGGLPSAYTQLTQAQIEAYLDALAAVSGGFASFASLNGFFTGYYSFVSGGGDPDQFNGLPGMDGVPVQLAGYSGGFNPAVANINIIIGGQLRGGAFSGGESGFTTDSFALDANGNLRSYVRSPGGQSTTPGSTTTTDIVGNADVVIGRWTSGSITRGSTFTFNANQGLHYMLARQPSAPFTAPTSGRIDYYLIGATRPTIADGSLAPGRFDAAMAILFGTTNLLALEGRVTMPTGGADLVRAFGTTGGIANADQSNVSIGINERGQFNAYIPGLVGNGCDPDLCGFGLFASYAGDGTDTIGATYQLYTGEAGKNIVGAAIFASGPDRTAGTGGNTGGNTGNGALILPYTGGFTGTGTGIIAAGPWADDGRDPIADAYVRNLRILGQTPYDAILDSNGGLESYIFPRDGFVFATRGTSQVAEVSGDEDLLIGRWTNGVYQRSNGRGELFDYALSANQGFHYLLASSFDGPANYPTGRIYYDLLAATSPTLIDGSRAPGNFDADAAIIFGANPAIAIEGTLTFSDFLYTFATEGGVEGAGQAIFLPNDGSNSLGYFNFSAPGSRGSDYQGQIAFEAQIADPEASRFGVLYTATDFGLTDSSDSVSINGAAIFGMRDGQSGGGNTGGNTPVSDFTGTRTGQVYYTFTNGSLASGFGGSADLENGNLTKFVSGLGTIDVGSASVVEAGDVGEFAWGRWTNGDASTSGVQGDATISLGANAGYHVMSGTPTTDLPTSGKIDYTLIATTSPTDNRGTAPGTLTGALAIDFGAGNKVGYDFTMELGGMSWAVATTGGAADPTQSQIALRNSGGGPIFGGAFTSTSNTVTGTGGACAGSCFVNISGALYGSGASYAGVAMNVLDSSAQNGSIQATGLAIFSSMPSPSTSLASAKGSATAPAPRPAMMVANPADWSRFANSASVAAPGLTPATGNTPTPVARAQAEALLGGMISFDKN